MLASTMLATSGHAATIVWSGGSSSDWLDPANWTGGVVPGTADLALVNQIVVFPQVTSSTVAAGSLSIGDTANGILTISTGGSLSATGSIITGNAAGTLGIINISNGGSLTTGNTSTYVGNSGKGELNITSGGTANLYTVISGYNKAAPGPNPAAGGDILVSGAGSLLNVRNQITISNGGPSTLIVTDNGTVNSTGYMIAGNNSSKGTVTVDNGGLLSVTGDFAIGNSGDAVVNIGPGGTVVTGPWAVSVSQTEPA